MKINILRPYPGKSLQGITCINSFLHYTLNAEKEAVFNYRLSRARRTIENSFGILAARWCLFRRPIIADPDRVVIYCKAAIALHNYLRTTESTVYCPLGFVDGEDGAGNSIDGVWRADEDPCSGLEPLQHILVATGLYFIAQTTHLNLLCNRYSRSAACVRDCYRDYFNSPAGEVCWQYSHVRRT